MLEDKVLPRCPDSQLIDHRRRENMALGNQHIVIVALVVTSIGVCRSQAPTPILASIPVPAVTAKEAVLLGETMVQPYGQGRLVRGKGLEREIVVEVRKRIVRSGVGQRHVLQHSQRQWIQPLPRNDVARKYIPDESGP